MGMTASFSEVYRLALQLDESDRDRLARYLNNPPPPPSAQDVLQTLHEHAAELQRRGVVRIGVFGSSVRAEAAVGSDVDILVELEQPSLTGFVGLKLYLEEILDRPVDLVTAEALRDELRSRVLDEVVYAQGI